MIVTCLEAKEKGKYKVYIDESYHFLLYLKDINKFGLCEGNEIPGDIYRDIYFNTVLRRGKQKALAILKYMDRTKQELILKLKQAEYTDNVIEEIMEYVIKFHFIDDTRYVSNYIRGRKDNKSKRQLITELSLKGIDKETINTVLLDEYDSEEEAVKKAVEKKCRNIDNLSKEERIKLASYLYRKGYQMDLIRKYVYDYEN